MDIQAKLRAGKGAGYERWAKKFNARELAKTLNFLSEAGVSDHADVAPCPGKCGDHSEQRR